MRMMWLGLSALLLLAAPGCGDDTATPTQDLAMSTDLAMPAVGDMAHETCAKAFQCGLACGQQHPDTLLQCVQTTCLPGLAASSAATSKTLFLALFGCLEQTCTADGGAIDLSCLQNAITPPSGACVTPLGMCTADK